MAKRRRLERALPAHSRQCRWGNEASTLCSAPTQRLRLQIWKAVRGAHWRKQAPQGLEQQGLLGPVQLKRSHLPAEQEREKREPLSWVERLGSDWQEWLERRAPRAPLKPKQRGQERALPRHRSQGPGQPEQRRWAPRPRLPEPRLFRQLHCCGRAVFRAHRDGRHPRLGSEPASGIPGCERTGSDRWRGQRSSPPRRDSRQRRWAPDC